MKLGLIQLTVSAITAGAALLPPHGIIDSVLWFLTGANLTLAIISLATRS